MKMSTKAGHIDCIITYFQHGSNHKGKHRKIFKFWNLTLVSWKWYWDKFITPILQISPIILLSSRKIDCKYWQNEVIIVESWKILTLCLWEKWAHKKIVGVCPLWHFARKSARLTPPELWMMQDTVQVRPNVRWNRIFDWLKVIIYCFIRQWYHVTKCFQGSNKSLLSARNRCFEVNTAITFFCMVRMYC